MKLRVCGSMTELLASVWLSSAKLAWYSRLAMLPSLDESPWRNRIQNTVIGNFIHATINIIATNDYTRKNAPSGYVSIIFKSLSPLSSKMLLSWMYNTWPIDACVMKWRCLVLQRLADFLKPWLYIIYAKTFYFLCIYCELESINCN